MGLCFLAAKLPASIRPFNIDQSVTNSIIPKILNSNKQSRVKMSSHATLSAASDDRKARLAKLKSLKRKQPTEQDDDNELTSSVPQAQPQDQQQHQQEQDSNTTTSTNEDDAPTKDISLLYLSGRNYDPTTKGPKLGFEAPPTLGLAQPTLEEQALDLEDESRRQAAIDAAQEDHKIDLFKLQPKRPNWDLKRELNLKMEVLNVRTENAIARLVRERLQGKSGSAGQGEKAGREDGGEEEGGLLDGAAIVEGMRLREREEEEENRREREAEAEEFGMA